MSLQERLNAAVENRNSREEKYNYDYNESSNDNEVGTLATNLRPSVFLPIRTATYAADVEMAKMPNISFYKKNEDGTFEVHNNATKGWESIIDSSVLHQVLKETAWELSYTGESDIALLKTGSKVTPLKIDLIQKQYFPTGELMYYHGLLNVDTGTAPFILTKEFYFEGDNVIMKNKPYDKDEDGLWRSMDVDKFNKKYHQDILPTINLGPVMIPVVTMTNTGADRWGSGKSDWKDATDILARLDIVEDAIDRSIKASKTRIWQPRKNGAMDLGTASNRKNAEVQQLLNDAEVINFVQDPHADIDTNFQITDRSLNVQEWYQVRSSLMNEYMAHTGENVAADAHGNNQHTYEVQSRGDNKYRRFTAKRTQRQKELETIIKIIVMIAKDNGSNAFVGVDEIAIDINETDIRTVYEIEEKVEKLLDLGLISKVQALMKLQDISESTAIRMLTEKDKHDEMFEEEEPEMEVQLPGVEQEVEPEDTVEPTEDE